MEALEGTFEIDSTPGRGTTATLSLPLREAGAESGAGSCEFQEAANQSAQNPQPSERQAHTPNSLAFTIQDPALRQPPRLRVLLADDHAMVRQGLKGVLDTYADIQVVGEAGNGEEAMRLAGDIRPDVILMDVNMPKMDGIEATRRIKKAFPSVMVIGLSVQNVEHVETAMRKAGAVAFLNKEAAVGDLYKTIQELCKES